MTTSIEMLNEGFPERTLGNFSLWMRYVRLPQTMQVGWMPAILGLGNGLVQNGSFFPDQERTEALASGETMLEEQHAASELALRKTRIRIRLYELGQAGQITPTLMSVLLEAGKLGIDQGEITLLTGYSFEETPPA